jgi:hypothetical protein
VYRHEEETIVTAQDGTGNPGPERKTDERAPQRFSWRNVGVFLGLLLANYLVVSLLVGPLRIPASRSLTDRRS